MDDKVNDMSKTKMLVVSTDTMNGSESDDIFHAAKNGRTEIIKQLHFKNPGTLDEQNDDDETALTLACEHADLKTVKLLLELGADIEHGSCIVCIACMH